ncbi:MAG: DUF3068 domain-containing protein [Mycobacteriaceae bacterium]
MANRSSSKNLVLACLSAGLGAFLLIAAVLIPTYTVDKLKKTPLDLEITSVTEGRGDVLNAASLSSSRVKVDTGVPIVAQRYVTVQEPSDSEIITVQAGQSIRRTDKQGDTGLVDANVDTVTLDRVSSMPVGAETDSYQMQKGVAAEPVVHTGLQYKFPFDTKKESYPYFDITSRQQSPADYVGEEEINGLKVYHFVQRLGLDENGNIKDPVDLSKAVPKSTSYKVTLPASQWGVDNNDSTPVTMTRFYTIKRDLYVEPETGVVIKGSADTYQYFARNGLKPEVTTLKYTATFNEKTVEYQVDKAKEGKDKLSLYGRILPIGAGIAGLLLLVVGLVLGLRLGRQPAGNSGNLGDAPTETIPTQRGWNEPPTQS